MSNAVIWSSLLVVVALIVGGVLMVRSTTPPEEVFPSPTAVFDTEPDEFIEEDSLVVPPSALPSESPNASPAIEGVGAASAAPSASQTVRVAITDTGFSPASVTVPANTTVTFVNNGQGAHWPASAPHPTHDALPGFDARQGLTTGETYNFTFTQKGSWQYHDHLHPQFTGTIIVQ